MTLAAGLYKSQDQQEQDLTDGPGWTIDDQKPSVFGGLAEAIPRGIGEGAAAGISMLTHGIHEALPALMQANPFVRLMKGNEAVKTLPGAETAMQIPGALSEAEISTRNVAKSMVGDPRTTGAAANVIAGFSKAATEFTVGSLAGGPAVGATLLGATDGYAHYADLLDQGVDHETAAKSGVLTAITSGGVAFLPMGMPAKWLAGLSRPAALLAQVGAGSAINTSFGAATRYASAKILEDAGYHEQAEQQKPWDETNLLTDAITGMFFGAHAGWHGLKNVDPAHVDPSIRDAAKVVQDRQEVNERAPGVPVDMASAAVHRQALETALGDLMAGKPVDLSDIQTEGATFARPDVDEAAATKIIRDAFAKSGVLDDAAQFDRWLTGDQEIEAERQSPEPERKSQAEALPQESVKPGPADEGGGYDVGEGELTDEQRKAFGLPALGEVGERPEGAGKVAPVLSGADRRGSPSEGVKVYRGARRPLSDADFEGEALGHSTGNPTSGTGVWFTTDSAEAARWGTVSEHSLHLENPKVIKGESFPEFDSLAEANAYQKKLIAEGHDGILMKNSHFGGKDHYVAFSPEALKAAEPGGPQIHEMSAEQMRAEADKQDAKDVDTLKEAFGNESDARKFQKLAASNSDSAYERGDKMLEKLTPEQRALVEHWEQRGPDTPRFDSGELRGVAKGMDHIAGAETPEELGGLLAHDLTDVGEKTNPAEMNAKELTAYMRLRRAMEIAQERGWNTADISRDAIRASARRFSDPLDAEYMLSRFLKTEGPAAPAIHDRPGLAVVDETGEPHAAALTYDGALAAEAQANKEAEPMFQAAVGCEARHQ